MKLGCGIPVVLISLMLLAFGCVGMFTFLIPTPLQEYAFSNFVCSPSESYDVVEIVGTGVNRGETIRDLYCVNDFSGERREVTGVGFGMTALSFLLITVGFVGALMAFTAILGSPTTPKPSTGFPSAGGQNLSGNSFSVSSDLNEEEMQEVLRHLQNPGGASMGAPPPSQGAGSANLAERLKQLDEAHAAGLITQQEYEQQRKALLDRFTGS